jgi:hypothetical protein
LQALLCLLLQRLLVLTVIPVQMEKAEQVVSLWVPPVSEAAEMRASGALAALAQMTAQEAMVVTVATADKVVMAD